jgi:ribosomal protein S18 acetylase RimI-like enzyme
MSIGDYDDVVALWRASPGVHVERGDSRAEIARYLRRNPGMSFVARDGGRMVGAVLCGHDGRWGSINHLAVVPTHRRGGVGRRLVNAALRELRRAGVRRCFLLVRASNRLGLRFWTRTGWLVHPGVRYATRDLAVRASSR